MAASSFSYDLARTSGGKDGGNNSVDIEVIPAALRVQHSTPCAFVQNLKMIGSYLNESHSATSLEDLRRPTRTSSSSKLHDV